MIVEGLACEMRMMPGMTVVSSFDVDSVKRRVLFRMQMQMHTNPISLENSGVNTKTK